MEKFKSGLAKISYAIGYVFGFTFMVLKKLFAL